MTNTVVTTIIATAFTVAFLHAAIPTHWLPFVLTARVQKWNKSKTLLITTLAGCGHVLFTAALGFLVAWCGIKLNDKIGRWFPWIAGGTLFAFGLYYVIQQIRGQGHGHSHHFGGHAHGEVERGSRGGLLVNLGHGFVEITVFETGVPPHFRLFFYDQRKQARTVPTHATVEIETVRPDGARETFDFRGAGDYLKSTSDIPEPHEFKAILQLSHGSHTHRHEVQFEEHGHTHHTHGGCDHDNEAVQPPARKSDWAAIVSLLALLTFSPCEGFLPVYVSGVRYGWSGFFLLTLILSVATVAGMIVFTWLTLAGMEKLKLVFLEKYERGILGGLLCLLGILVIVFEH